MTMVYYLDIFFQLIKPSICLGVEIPSSLSGWVKSDKELYIDTFLTVRQIVGEFSVQGSDEFPTLS